MQLRGAKRLNRHDGRAEIVERWEERQSLGATRRRPNLSIWVRRAAAKAEILA